MINKTYKNSEYPELHIFLNDEGELYVELHEGQGENNYMYVWLSTKDSEEVITELYNQLKNQKDESNSKG